MRTMPLVTLTACRACHMAASEMNAFTMYNSRPWRTRLHQSILIKSTLH